jgi:hypothetical protein
MMTPFHIIEDVASFDHTGSNLFFVEKEGGSFCAYNFDDQKINLIRDNVEFVNTACIRNNVLTIDADNRRTLVFDNETMDLVQEIPFIINANSAVKRNRSTSEFYYPRIDIGEEKKSAKVSQVTNEVLETYPSDAGLGNMYKVISDDHFISKNREEIGLYTFAGLQQVWKRSYADILKTEKRANLFGDVVYDSALYIFLNDEHFNHPVTAKLDIMTGEVKEMYPEFGGYLKRSGQSLYAIRYETEIQEFDPSSGTVHVFDAKEELKENGFDSIHDSHWIVSGNHLFFGQSEGVKQSMAGIFDLETEKIIWKHQFQQEHRYIGDIQLFNNRLLFHMRDMSLFIFDLSNVV